MSINVKPKVAIIEPVGGHGGMHYYDFGLLDGLEAAGLRAAFYTCDRTDPPIDHIRNSYLFFRKIYGKSSKIIRFVRFVIGLQKSLIHARLNGANLVHYHLFHYTVLELIELALACLLGIRIVLTVHDAESFVRGSSHQIARIVFKAADGIIVHNEVSRQAVLDILPGASIKMAVIPHGNYVKYTKMALDRESARASLDIPLSSHVVLFFGQIKKVKGLDILLHAWKDIPPIIPNSLLLVAGKIWKDDLKIYNEIIESYGITSSVRFDIRYIPDNEASLYYAAADLIVLPYRKIFQSGVLLMAMSHARAVLVSDLPGMTEIIKDGENGIVFHGEDSHDLSKMLIRSMQDTRSLELIAIKGYQTVLLENDWHKIGYATKLFYEQIVNR